MKKTLLLLSLFLWIACEREVEIDAPPYASKIVVNGLLNNESEIRVSVSRSVVALSDDRPTYLENAVAELWEDGVSIGTGTYDAFNKYYSWPQNPKPGSSYRLRVTHPDYPEIDETMTMPNPGTLGGVVYFDSVGIDTSGNALAAMEITINDPAGEKNFYKVFFSYYFQGSVFLPFEFLTNDAILQSPSTIKEDDGSYLFSDELFNGQNRTIRVEFSRDITTGSPRFMVLSQVLSQDMYKYQVSLTRFEESKDNPFVEPVFVYSNIRKGLGILAGSIAERDTIN